MPIRLHEENPALFREAIEFTSAETGFSARLIEKDYYCSVLLEDLGSIDFPMVFKGGTLLAKVHSDFYRLSEDLDFSISTPASAAKKTRSQAVAPMKAHLAQLTDRHSYFQLEEPLRGFNKSTQYNALVSYPSALTDRRENIKIEIGVREETMTPVHTGQATTLLRNPVRGAELIERFSIAALSYSETMAEKLRAALCRREVAIRDFFDIDHAVHNGGLNTLDAELLDLLRRKLQVDGTGPVDVSENRLKQLLIQLEAQLRPVLRTQDFEKFDLHRAFDTVVKVAETIG